MIKHISKMATAVGKPKLVALLGAAFTLASVNAQETLYSFSDLPQTNSAVLEASDGNFYGTAYWGGDTSLNSGRGYGKVYKITPSGLLTDLAWFNASNGGHPRAGVIQGTDGNFYGTTYYGGNLLLNSGNGYGTVYKMSPDGTLTNLHQFDGTHGGLPYAGLVQGTNGYFYGTTYWGGAYNLGTVFKLASDGTYTSLVAFNTNNGGHPSASLIQASDGNFYGTTYWGGNQQVGDGNGLGTVFKMTPDGVLTTLVQFNGTNGGHPWAGVIQASDGNFYGTTYWGGDLSVNGANGYGSVYKMSPDGTLSTLTTFEATNGGHPYAGVVEASDGNFYGTTFYGGNLLLNSGNGYGTAFQMMPDGTLNTLVAFTDQDDGAQPYAGLVQSRDGSFYGIASEGGAGGGGTFFRLAVLPPSLGISFSSGNIMLSWPGWATNFSLLYNPELTTANWTNVTAQPLMNSTNFRYELAVPASDRTGLFRLKQQ